MILLLVCTVAFYLASTVLIGRQIQGHRDGSNGSAPSNPWSMLLVAISAVGHGWLLARSAIPGNAINLALGHIASMVCLTTVLVYLFASLGRNVSSLGIIVLPIGLAGLLTGYLVPGPELLLHHPPASLASHLGIALLAFAVLCIATAQAALLYIQEQQLHSRNPGRLFTALPPLQTMESNLLQLNKLGVALLTINLATGMLSSLQVYGKLLDFNHHILLSIIAWLGYSALLVGHKVYGWRGKIAAKWTILAFLVLLMAYFGTRFVRAIILA